MKLKKKYEKKVEMFDKDEMTEEIAILSDFKDKSGWISPNYSQSRTVQLNPFVMEKNRCVAMFSNKPEIDYYKVLRQQILRITEDLGGNTIMVTSTLPGEGKTLTAINLAFTFAREYEQTVLLVDCDLKKQNIHEVLGYESDKGLVNYLLSECEISDLIVWPSIEKLTIISGGKTIDQSSEVLGSPLMKELVTDMKNRYPERYIIFDVPPVFAGVDTMIFANLVDHILVVVEADKTPMPELKMALDMLPKEKIRGLILNRQQTPDTPISKYYYQKKKLKRQWLPGAGA
ncbi:MAG: polysaccharide biosynthesis tyrosine autokinase [Syntrophomonas sp.]